MKMQFLFRETQLEEPNSDYIYAIVQRLAASTQRCLDLYATKTCDVDHFALRISRKRLNMPSLFLACG